MKDCHTAGLNLTMGLASPSLLSLTWTEGATSTHAPASQALDVRHRASCSPASMHAPLVLREDVRHSMQFPLEKL